MMEIEIETFGDPSMITGFEDVVSDLPGMLTDLGAEGPAVSAGGVGGGLAATFSLERGDTAWGEYTNVGLQLFEDACTKLGLVHGPIARVAVFTEELLERELDQEPEVFLGVTELASELGVSRQRVSELRTRRDFPAPVAELAAGPVWRLANLKRFMQGWERRPGRPAKRLTASERQLLELVARGLSAQQMADEAGLEITEVQRRLAAILRKLEPDSKLRADIADAVRV